MHRPLSGIIPDARLDKTLRENGCCIWTLARGRWIRAKIFMPLKNEAERKAYQREYSRRWYLAHRELTILRSKAWRQAHRELVAQRKREWRKTHPEKRKPLTPKQRERKNQLQRERRALARVNERHDMAQGLLRDRIVIVD
jgi:hypothetical protein